METVAVKYLFLKVVRMVRVHPSNRVLQPKIKGAVGHTSLRFAGYLPLNPSINEGEYRCWISMSQVKSGGNSNNLWEELAVLNTFYRFERSSGLGSKANWHRHTFGPTERVEDPKV